MTPDEISAAADAAGPLPIGRPRREDAAARHDRMHDAIAAKTALGDDRSLVWSLRSHLEYDHGVPLYEVARANVDVLVARHDALHAEGS